MRETLWNKLTRREVLMGGMLTLLLSCGAYWVAEPSWFGPGAPGPIGGRAQAGAVIPRAPAPGEPLSDAERISRMQRYLDASNAALKEIQCQLDDPSNEYFQAEGEFEQLDADLAEKKKQRKKLGPANPKAVEMLDAEVTALEDDWTRARDRFNLLITERRTLQEKAAALQQTIQQNQQVLAALNGTDQKTAPQPTAQVRPEKAASGENPSAPPKTAEEARPATPPVAGKQPETELMTPALGKKPPSKALVDAQKEVVLKEAVAKVAKDKAQSTTARVQALRKSIALEQKLLSTAQAKATQAQQTQQALNMELERKREDPAAVEAIRARMVETERRMTAARDEVNASSERLNDLHGELNDLQAEDLAATRDVEQKERDVASAQEKVVELQNPFTLVNLLHWLADRGPRLVLIALGILLLHLLVGQFTRQIVKVVAGTSTRGTEEERENRADTLVSVFRNTAYFVIIGGGIVMLLDVAGIPVIPLMGGAAVIGLAVAFGAQNLIRDYFSGFMVLMEDQYGINDVVKIGGTSGLVEKITLRMTVLRDIEGVVHFIPHGTITTVSNMTHGWSRALFDIGVAYKENVDRAMAVLVELGKELRRDAKFGPLILADPEMLGVDGLGDSAVMIRFFVKTRPLQQWTVRRELLRRIKNKFDELGIEIPFPHQTVYHRYEEVGDMGRPPRDRDREAAA